MNIKTLKYFLTLAAVFGCAASCVYVDETLGSNMIPSNQLYEVHMTEFPLTEVKMGFADSLSAYSDTRITIGAMRDERYGLSTRGSAFTIVPVADTVDVGLDPIVSYFHFAALRDTTSVGSFDQQKIIQCVNVYELAQMLDTTFIYTRDDRYDTFYDSSTRISTGVPIYDGGDSLSFDFSKAYAEKVINVFKENPEIAMNLTEYYEKLPGIYLSVDPPLGYGGRINMFNSTLAVDDYGYVTSGYAAIVFKTKYSPEEEYRDTSFVFYFGPEEKSEDTAQYVFNISQHESKTIFSDTDEKGFLDCGEKIYIEGGSGLKPVFSAIEMKHLMLDELAEMGLGAEDVIINKATITMPFEEPDDYDYYYLMPDVLSPTCKFSYDSDMIKADGNPLRYVYYANLTDSSVDDENQGDINRSLDKYAPDITHHLQQLIQKDDETLAKGEHDVWMLVLSKEEITTDTSNSDMAEYYEYLAYSAYYDTMYEGYGSYGADSYSNYYYYMYLADYYANSSSTNTENVLDKDKYYTAALNGPASDNGPSLKVTYSIRKTQEDE